MISIIMVSKKLKPTQRVTEKNTNKNNHCFTCKGYFIASLKIGRSMTTAKLYDIEGHLESPLSRCPPKTSGNSELDSLLRDF